MATIIHDSFEWDSGKAEANAKKHGVTFAEASTVFDDPRAIEAQDHLDEGRFVIIGMSRSVQLLFVVHCERGERIRIISARPASRAQQRKYADG